MTDKNKLKKKYTKTVYDLMIAFDNVKTVSEDALNKIIEDEGLGHILSRFEGNGWKVTKANIEIEKDGMIIPIVVDAFETEKQRND